MALSNDPIDVTKKRQPIMVEPVIKNKPVIKKKKNQSLLGQAIQQWVINDAETKAKNFVNFSLIPNMKRTVLELVENMLNMKPTNSGYSSSYSNYSYGNLGPTVRPNSYYSGNQPPNAGGVPIKQMLGVTSDYHLPYVSMSDAKDVLDAMRECIREHGACSIGHMYQFSNIQNFEFSSYNFGWGPGDLDNINLITRKNGVIIDLPQPKQIVQ